MDIKCSDMDVPSNHIRLCWNSNRFWWKVCSAGTQEKTARDQHLSANVSGGESIWSLEITVANLFLLVGTNV